MLGFLKFKPNKEKIDTADNMRPSNNILYVKTHKELIETLATQYKSSQVNILLYNVGWCDVVRFPCYQLSGAGHVTSRSRQASALPGPGVKKEIFKSKFDMIWTLISLMFESQVGTKDVESSLISWNNYFVLSDFFVPKASQVIAQWEGNRSLKSW